MKVLDPGHRYLLAPLDGGEEQVLQFVKRMGEHYPGNASHYGGTTMQDVMRVLLDRARYVNQQIPCAETAAVIQCLQQALLLCEIRAKRVKGLHLQAATLDALEALPACATCGHVECGQHR